MVYHTDPETRVLEHNPIQLFHHFSWHKEGDVCDASLTNSSYLLIPHHIRGCGRLSVSMDIV